MAASPSTRNQPSAARTTGSGRIQSSPADDFTFATRNCSSATTSRRPEPGAKPGARPFHSVVGELVPVDSVQAGRVVFDNLEALVVGLGTGFPMPSNTIVCLLRQ